MKTNAHVSRVEAAAAALWPADRRVPSTMFVSQQSAEDMARDFEADPEWRNYVRITRDANGKVTSIAF